MLTHRLRFLALPLILAACLAAPANSLAKDDQLDAHGLSRLVDQARGRILVVNFWASWCRPCRREIPDLEKLRLTVPEDQVLLVGVSLDFDREMYEHFKDERRFGYPVHLAAPGLMDELRITAVPKTLVYGPSGKQLHNHDGPMGYPELFALVTSLLHQTTKGDSP